MKLQSFFRFFAIGLIYLTFSSRMFAQDPPIKWGEIPRADLEMKSFPQDTNASAVILCDYGESRLSHEMKNTYQKHLRVKIFTAKGYELATQRFFIYGKKKKMPLRVLEGATYWIDEHGEIIKSELRQEDLFSNEISDRKTDYWVTMPNIKPGCVFELRYTIDSWSSYIREWSFQWNEPVRWSEYRILFPKNYVSYSAIHQGKIPYVIRENTTMMLLGGTMPFVQMRWAVQNVPALRKEPYMTSIYDYTQRVDIQLSGHKFTISGKATQFLDTWDSFRKELFEDEEFGKKPDDTRTIRKLAEQITAGLSTQEEKLRALYSWVSKSIVWSGFNDPFAWRDVQKVLETKKGNNADINFLLLSLSKAANIKGDPVILSTRGNGKFNESYPVASQFNYMLARASIDSQYYYLDATDPDRPFDLLPIELLNVKALAVKENSLEWVKLSSPKRYTNISAANIILQKDGSISGTLEDMYNDYGSFEMRDNLKDKKDIDIAKELFDTENREITIDSLNVEAKDSIDLPLKVKAQISSSTYAQSNGDLIYFNPHIIHRLTENPLKSEKRNFPLDYAYQREHTAIVNLTIPDSFEVHESVVSRSLIVGSNLAVFSRKVLSKGNQIRIQYKWEIRETEIDTVYYERMRDFYAQIIAIESEQFVFARIKPQVVPASNIVPSATGTQNEVKPSKKKGKR